MSRARSGEILFVKSVKDGVPNRDPLAESDARRIFGEADGRISLSDVSIKRDVRDYVLDKFPDGGADKNYFVFVHEARNEKGKLMKRDELAKEIQEKAELQELDSMQEVLCQAAFDVRTFGAVYSVSKGTFHLTGPVQFAWAHSLHPVETHYVQGTVVMPSEEGKEQGTIWTTYITPFAVFAMHGVINQALGEKTGLNDSDVDLLLEGLWRGTQNRQARGRGIQQPLCLVHVEYTDPYFRIGYLDEKIKLLPERDAWLDDVKPSRVSEVELDLTGLNETLERYTGKIARCRYWLHPDLAVRGTPPGEAGEEW